MTDTNKNVNNNIGAKIDEIKHLLDIKGEKYPEDPKVDYSCNETSKPDEYKKAAKEITDYVSAIGYSFEESEEEMQQLYYDFQKRFSPDKLKAIADSDLLKYMFYSAEQTNDSLCYWLEFHSKNKACFGSIAGGSSYKFGLFQKKDNGVWVTGSPQKSEELSAENALKLGCEIRDKIIAGADIILKSDLNTLEGYEKLDDSLNSTIGRYASLAWLHKYYCMIFPLKFATWHSSEWQKHILYAYGIKPSVKYYGRSGQLALIADYAKMSGAFFAHASYYRFGDIKQFCRIGTSDSKKNYFQEWKKNNIVAIGWNELESLDNYVMGTDINRKVIQEKLEAIYYSGDSRLASRKAGEIATFYRTKENTVFVAMKGESLLALGDKVGIYFYDNNNGMHHCKSVKWGCCFVKDDKLPNEKEGYLTTCVELIDVSNIIYLYHKYYNFTTTDAKEIEDQEIKLVERKSRTDLLHPLNQIIYGAPGTGKTYSSVEYAVAIIEHREINNNQYTWAERKQLMNKYGKFVKSGQIIFTTFHQSYGYEEFIQGIRPNSNSGTIGFQKTDGIFKKIADRALIDEDNNYVIIIDEINRGNISKVFGELITLIEEDKRYGELNQLIVTLPLGDQFTVPNNLYIIGTMNSADKSISLIDIALRRRFSFVEMAPDTSIITDAELKRVIETLNDYLKKELHSTDLLIGHSFFIGKTAIMLGDIMNRNIIPLLYEYFYDDNAKVKKALECINGTGFEIDTGYCGRIRIVKKA